MTFTTNVLTRVAALTVATNIGPAFGHAIDTTNRKGYVSTYASGIPYLVKYDLDTMAYIGANNSAPNCLLGITLDIPNQTAYVAAITSNCGTNIFNGGPQVAQFNLSTFTYTLTALVTNSGYAGILHHITGITPIFNSSFWLNTADAGTVVPNIGIDTDFDICEGIISAWRYNTVRHPY